MISAADRTHLDRVVALARRAAENLAPAECREATVHTSGEHCPMRALHARRAG